MDCKFCKHQISKNTLNLCEFHYEWYQTKSYILTLYFSILDDLLKEVENGKIDFCVSEGEIRFYELKIRKTLDIFSKYEN